MFFLFVPFFYTFHTRLKTNFSKVAWFFTYVIPVLICCYCFNLDLFFSILLIFSIYSSYEIGYIYNDCEVVKREINPTLRLSASERKFYEENKIAVYGIRTIFLALILICIFIFYQSFFSSTSLVVFFIFLTYLVYNNIRNNLNLPLYSFLVFLRYFAFFPFLLWDANLAILLFLVYPLCAFIEFSKKERFLTSKFIKIDNIDKFRVFYYALLLLCSSFLYFTSNQYFLILFILSFYFFSYRLLSFLFLSKKVRGAE